MSPFWIFVISFAAGAGIGVFIAYQMRAGKDCALLKQQLEELQQEHAEYKQGVGRHFVETSTLINNLTQSYKDVHQHLSNGAQTLCPEDVALELQRSTVPLIRDAIEGESRPHVPDTPREPAAATASESGARQVDEPAAAEQVSQAPESVSQAPEPEAAQAEVEEQPPEVAEPADFPQPEAVTSAPDEATPPPAEDKPEQADEAPEPEHLNMEDVVRHAQGAKGRREEEVNLADIARHAEGAFLDDDQPAPAEPTPEQIAEAEKLASAEEEEKSRKTADSSDQKS